MKLYHIFWLQAFEKWVPSLNQEDIHVVGSGQRKKDFGLITIISYDLMSRRSKELAAQMYQVVIMVLEVLHCIVFGKTFAMVIS